MLIINTIIRNGISRGIPEGTKVPEKPQEDKNGIAIAQWTLKVDYEKAIQALWDASPEWEDQFAIENFLPDEAYGIGDDFIDGIYPLEGVEAREVRQFKDIIVTPGKWRRVPDEEEDETLDGLEYRWVLRLIPQPKSEQKTIELKEGNQKGISTYVSDTIKEIDLEEFTEHAQKLKFTQELQEQHEKSLKVEVTEVSEPSQNVVFDLVKHPPKAAPAVKFKMGVDEKKKPDYDRDQFLNERDDRGVSEGEPNQDVNAVLEELHTMFVEGKTHKEILSKFHIQKLKP